LDDLLITPGRRQGMPGRAQLGALAFRCALGRGGVSPAKIEGDGTTPVGSFPIRKLFYRPDRVRGLVCRIPVLPMSPSDGWGDDPGDAAYNRQVTRPYPGRHETMWREDAIYDLVLVIGHNDDPVVPGKGSAVFLHLAQPDYAPTDGCVAFARADFVALLGAMEPATNIVILEKETGA
jgi:L,D-peptidoglycan transpeptidase YkuD (ErfK/YbiS/YcfS/YnhG family)